MPTEPAIGSRRRTTGVALAIEVPAEELGAVASALRTQGRSSAESAEVAARAADHETDGILHQTASGLVSSVAQKLAHSVELGGVALTGLSDGLVDVARRFGVLDRSAGPPDLGGPR